MFTPRGLGRYWLTLVTGDLVATVIAVYGGRFMIPLEADVPSSPEAFWILTPIFGLLWLAALYFADMYTLEEQVAWSGIVSSILLATLNLSLAVGLLVLVEPDTFELGRRFYLTYLTSGALLLTAWRCSASILFTTRASLGVLIVGIGEGARSIADEVRRRSHLGFRFLGFAVYRRPELRHGLAPRDLTNASASSTEPVHLVSSLKEIACNTPVKTLVMAEPESAGFPVREVMEWQMSGGRVTDLGAFYEELTGKLPLPFMHESWHDVAPNARRSLWRLRFKRVLDIAVAAILLLITAPFALIVAIAIKLDSPGPVLYSQDRVGKGGTDFRLYKFRSMRDDAEKESGAVWAAHNDFRVTRVGRVLRRLRIDELPQLFNVLWGDMSLVGPRPERPELAESLGHNLPWYDYRHSVQPGLTGWAQVCLPYGASVDDALEKLCYDLYYIKNWSPGFDLQIALQTVKVVLLQRGSR